jgi:twitching motility protein PilT
MSLIESLLDAIVRLDGDALVLHVGEKPYVITSSSALNAFRGPLSWGQVELSTRALSLEAIGGILEQLLTAEQRELLGEMGAVEHELPATPERPAFTVIAARGGEDVWLEIRPVRPRAIDAIASIDIAQTSEPVAASPVVAASSVDTAEAVEPAVAPVEVDIPAVASEPLEGPGDAWEPFAPIEPPLGAETPVPDASEPIPVLTQPATFELVPEVEQEHPDDHEVSELLASAGWLETETMQSAVSSADQPAALEADAGDAGAAPSVDDRVLTPLLEQIEPVLEEAGPAPSFEVAEPTPILEVPDLAPPTAEDPELAATPEEAAAEPPPEAVAPAPPVQAGPGPELEEVRFRAEEPLDEARPGVVLPLARTLRDQPSVQAELPSSKPSLDRLLRIAAARGASGLYLVAQSRPVVRVDGEMQPIDGEESLSAGDVEAFTLGLTSEPNREAVRSGATSEWFSDFPELGRVRCFTFSDHRGPGVIVRMLPARAISVEQLGLSRDIRGLCEQPDGLVLVAGPRASGKSTLIAAFVELVNRSRADHVVTIERQITFVHESRRSFVSQREVRGEAEAIATAVRAALREDPDVLVIEELRSADVAAAAIEAAESGRLVLAGLRAAAAAPAIERLVEQFPAERRGQILRSLAGTLRGVVAQVLLRKRGGGRIAARELLLNTPAAASVIADGKLFQLGAALESGRKFGNVALNDTLLSLIRDGVVDAGEAWRRSHDRDGLLTLLKREGIDTSFVERLA